MNRCHRPYEFRELVEWAHRYDDLDTTDLLGVVIAAQDPQGDGLVTVEASALADLIEAYRDVCQARDQVAGMGEQVAVELVRLQERYTRHVIAGRCVCHEGSGACQGPEQ